MRATAVERQVRVAAPPVRVAAALAASPWRHAARVEPAGAGSRMVVMAAIAPPALARALEELLVAELRRIRTALEAGDEVQPPGSSSTS